MVGEDGEVERKDDLSIICLGDAIRCRPGQSISM